MIVPHNTSCNFFHNLITYYSYLLSLTSLAVGYKKLEARSRRCLLVCLVTEPIGLSSVWDTNINFWLQCKMNRKTIFNKSFRRLRIASPSIHNLPWLLFINILSNERYVLPVQPIDRKGRWILHSRFLFGDFGELGADFISDIVPGQTGAGLFHVERYKSLSGGMELVEWCLCD